MGVGSAREREYNGFRNPTFLRVAAVSLPQFGGAADRPLLHLTRAIDVLYRHKVLPVLTFRQRRSFSGKNNYLGNAFQRKLVWGAMLLIIGAILIGQSLGRIPTFQRLLSRNRFTEDNRVAAHPALTDPNSKVAAKAGLAGAEPDPTLKPVATKQLFGNAKPEWFLGLEDDAVYRRDENEAFFSLLKLVSTADERDIRLAAMEGTRSFRQLYDQPDDYRGEIVTVAGFESRILPQINPPANDQGIKKYYEVWIEPHGSRVPIVAICSELPPDYPTGGGDRIEVEISGFFYKRLGYASKEVDSSDLATGAQGNVFRSSPLVLAKTLTWRRVGGATAEAPAEIGPRMPLGIPQKYIYYVIGAGIFVMIMVSYWSFRMSRSSVLSQGPIIGRRRREAAEADAEPTDLNNLRL